MRAGVLGAAALCLGASAVGVSEAGAQGPDLAGALDRAAQAQANAQRSVDAALARAGATSAAAQSRADQAIAAAQGVAARSSAAAQSASKAAAAAQTPAPARDTTGAQALAAALSAAQAARGAATPAASAPAAAPPPTADAAPPPATTPAATVRAEREPGALGAAVEKNPSAAGKLVRDYVETITHTPEKRARDEARAQEIAQREAAQDKKDADRAAERAQQEADRKARQATLPAPPPGAPENIQKAHAAAQILLSASQQIATAPPGQGIQIAQQAAKDANAAGPHRDDRLRDSCERGQWENPNYGRCTYLYEQCGPVTYAAFEPCKQGIERREREEAERRAREEAERRAREAAAATAAPIRTMAAMPSQPVAEFQWSGGSTMAFANSLAAKHGLSISGGHRTPKRNAEVGGVSNSRHLRGTPQNPGAIDLVGSSSAMQAAAADARAAGLPEVLVHNVRSGTHLHLGFF